MAEALASRAFSFLSLRGDFHVSLDLLSQNMVVSRVDVFHIESGSETPGALRMFFYILCFSMVVDDASHHIAQSSVHV